MKTFLTLFFGLLLSVHLLFGQPARVVKSGTIEFEKTVNMFAVIKNMMDLDQDSFGTQFFEEYKKSKPQFKKLSSTLTFTDNQTLFKPGEEKETSSEGFFMNMAAASQPNLVYADYTRNTITIQKQVFEESFLLKDSLKNIKWKITDETRDIAGYPCRRANGIVMDSIYVVAFYTNRIPIPGGPESFSGLPGMILGAALPHENITWFATKVTEGPPAKPEPPKKGKLVTNKQLHDTLKNVMKNWGKQGNTYLRLFML